MAIFFHVNIIPYMVIYVDIHVDIDTNVDVLAFITKYM